MKGVKLGNAVIDGEVIGNQWKTALEIKSCHHHATTELVTSHCH
jgi:hypothetical protein